MKLPTFSLPRIASSVRTVSTNQPLRIPLFVIALALVVAAMTAVFDQSPWDFFDWTAVFYPAAGSPGDPYGATDFYLVNPPWLTWILFPLGLLSVDLAFAFWIVLTILVSAWCIFKLGGDRYIVLLSLLTPAFARVFILGQIDVLPLLGLTLIIVAPRIRGKTAGYLLLAIKPQVLGLGAVVAWLKLGRRDKLIVILAVLVVLVVSLLLYGNWISIAFSNMAVIAETSYGIQIWPYGLPIGLILFGISLKKRSEKLSGLATVFFVPYIGLHSLFPYIAVLFTMIPRLWASVVFVLLWIFALLAT